MVPWLSIRSKCARWFFCCRTLARAAVLAIAVMTAAIGPGASAGENNQPLRLVIHPAPAPYPALKYRFQPDLVDRIPGNAAVEYGKVTAEQGQIFHNTELWKDILRWLEAPLADLREEQVYGKTNFEKIFDDLDRASACDYCDWQLPFRRQPFYSILLSELQQTRSFARLLGVRARAEIAEGRFEDAVARFRAGYRLAQHVDEGQTLIHSLVSAAIAQILSAQVRQFVQQPGAPNLYWALAALPRPLVDARNGIDSERDALVLTFPELKEVEKANWPAERWQEVLDGLAAVLVEYRVIEGEPDVRQLLSQRMPKLLPTARQYLLEHGYASDKVDAMPDPQIAILYSAKLYNELRDEILKWYYVPYWQAHKPLEQVTGRIERLGREEQEILPLASGTLPAMLRARNSLVRADREIALLTTIEALRMYGAAHEGRLPKELSELTDSPAPRDPVTGEPFEYSLQGDTATIQGPPLPDTPYVKAPPRPAIPLHIEVRFAK